VLREAAKIARSSLAFDSILFILDSSSIPVSTRSSNHRTLSSASSTTIPIFEMNSALDRARYAALYFAAPDAPERRTCFPSVLASSVFGKARKRFTIRIADSLVRAFSCSDCAVTFRMIQSSMIQSSILSHHFSMLISSILTVCFLRKRAMIIANPTAASAAATVMTKKTSIWPRTSPR
jgi:hypothetical protein